MKTRILQILGVAAVATIGMVSCTVDACKDVECGTWGTCVEGDCVCDAGYEGVNCDEQERADFVGNYNVTEACTSGNYTYTITVVNSSAGITSILVTNFGDYGVDIVGVVAGDNVTFASQTQGGGTFSGSGQINGNILSITYNVTAGTSTDDCTMTCTKQ